jgi:hypothetical protein
VKKEKLDQLENEVEVARKSASLTIINFAGSDGDHDGAINSLKNFQDKLTEYHLANDVYHARADYSKSLESLDTAKNNRTKAGQRASAAYDAYREFLEGK